MNTHPFSISISQEALDDLAARLKNARFPDTVKGAGWDYCADMDYLKEFFE